MADRSSLALLQTPLVRLVDVACTAPRHSRPAHEVASATQVILPRRGVFTAELGGRGIVADPLTALVLPVGQEYRVAHPTDGGDHCTVLVFQADTVAEALGTRGPVHGTMGPASQLVAGVLRAALRRRGRVDELMGEEAAVRLLQRLARDLVGGTGAAEVGTGSLHRRRVDSAMELLASDPAHPWTLVEVAQQLNCSPYHLSRQFRRVSGVTIWQYVTRLRLALALDEILDAGATLSDIAARTGFAHHSHLTGVFRATFGHTPSAARSAASHGTAAELSKILTAAR